MCSRHVNDDDHRDHSSDTGEWRQTSARKKIENLRDQRARVLPATSLSVVTIILGTGAILTWGLQLHAALTTADQPTTRGSNAALGFGVVLGVAAALAVATWVADLRRNRDRAGLDSSIDDYYDRVTSHIDALQASTEQLRYDFQRFAETLLREGDTAAAGVLMAAEQVVTGRAVNGSAPPWEQNVRQFPPRTRG